MASKIIESEALSDEDPPESSTETPADHDSPRSFLDRCRALVEGITVPVQAVPMALKHRVRKFRPRARASYLRRRLSLLTPHIDERSARRLERILGVMLIIIAALLLRPEDITPEAAQAPAASFAESLLESQDADGMPETIEVPFLDEASVNPVLLQEMAPQANPRAFSRFHSYADPRKRFLFGTQPQWKTAYLMSSEAACGVARGLQQSLPVMIRRGRSPVWRTHPYVPVSARRIINHPLVARMMSQARQAAFQNYVDNGRMNAGTIPMSRVMHQFRSLSQVINESCGSAPAADEGESDEES